MTRFVALLRAVNLGSTNKVPMAELRALFEELGHEGVSTYLQSGNVVFDARSADARGVGAEIEDAIERKFGLEIAAILRTRHDMERAARSNPFAAKGVEPSKLHVMFLAERVSSTAAKALDANASPPDSFVVRGGEIYLWYPNGAGRSKLGVDYFERRLGTRATARNWNTVTKLLELMRAPS